MRSQDADGEALWLSYRPMFIRAFEDAADSTADAQVKGTKTATSHDYVQAKEFRLLCTYLCIYARMFDAFQAAVRVHVCRLEYVCSLIRWFLLGWDGQVHHAGRLEGGLCGTARGGHGL